MKTGEIVLIPIPFSELTEVKVRPAVLVTETKDKYMDLVLAAITSQVPAALGAFEMLLQPTSLNGLRAASIIKVDRLFTLKRTKVLHRLGSLDSQELFLFKSAFKQLVEE